MKITKMMMLGESGSGKSELIQQLAPDSFPVNISLENGVSYLQYGFRIAKNDSGPSYVFFCNDTKYNSLNDIYDCVVFQDYILYCIDLSQPIDMSQLNNKFKEIQKSTAASLFRPKSQSIILVGTKHDIGDDVENEHAFDTHIFDPDCNIVDVRYKTSTNNGYGIKELKDGLFALAQNKHWNEAVAELKARLQKCGLNDLAVIDSNLMTLKTGLDRGNANFADFVTLTHQNLDETLPAYRVPPMMQIITTFAYNSLWTIFAATLTGFTVGFMLGVWSGPGAFITGVLGASVAAQNTLLAAGVMGVIKGGYETQRLFQPIRSARESVHNFVFDIEHPSATVWAHAHDYMSRCGM